jgi:hypothetical protein
MEEGRNLGSRIRRKDLKYKKKTHGPFFSSCAIPPRVVGGLRLWSDGVGCDLCCYDCDSGGGV